MQQPSIWAIAARIATYLFLDCLYVKRLRVLWYKVSQQGA